MTYRGFFSPFALAHACVKMCWPWLPRECDGYRGLSS